MQPMSFWSFVGNCLLYAVNATLNWFGWNIHTLIASAVIILLGFFLHWRKKGRAEATGEAQRFLLIEFWPAVAVCVAVLLFNLFAAPHKIYLGEFNAAQQRIGQAEQAKEEAVRERSTADERLKTAETENKNLAGRLSAGAPTTPKKQCWAANHFEEPNHNIKEAVVATSVIIFCNTRVDAPFYVRVEFDRSDFKNASAFLANEGSTFGGSGPIEGKVFTGFITAPSLPAYSVIVVTVQGLSDKPPRARGIEVASR
jgi:hypothetical protein